MLLNCSAIIFLTFTPITFNTLHIALDKLKYLIKIQTLTYTNDVLHCIRFGSNRYIRIRIFGSIGRIQMDYIYTNRSSSYVIDECHAHRSLWGFRFADFEIQLSGIRGLVGLRHSIIRESVNISGRIFLCVQFFFFFIISFGTSNRINAPTTIATHTLRLCRPFQYITVLSIRSHTPFSLLKIEGRAISNEKVGHV